MRSARSLRRRVFWGFAGSAGIIWLAFVIGLVFILLTDGQRAAAQSLTVYARQILVLSVQLDAHPEQLREIVRQVIEIENAAQHGKESVGPVHVQIWSKDDLVFSSSELPINKPELGLKKVTVNGVEWWTETVATENGDKTVRLWGVSGIAIAIQNDSFAVLLLPMLFSFPIFLIPAWLMTRSGLRPLRDVVRQLDERMESRSRAPLSATSYIELNPIVDATNSWMAQLDSQLQRERGFAADVAHELKTPLAIVQANVDILSHSNDVSQKKQALDDLRAGVNRSDHLVAQLLELTRLERGADVLEQDTRIDLAEFLRTRVAFLEPLAHHREISLVVCAPETLSLELNLTAFSAVLDNLLDNAIKYGPSDSEVTVYLAEDDGRCELRVKDRGQGIAESVREQAFNRFERLGESGVQGAGLGLSIVKEALSRLGGRVAFADDDGWQVSVIFPCRGFCG